MKTILASIWKRRWCQILGFGLILCTLPLLHPFYRQSIFGPKFDDIPLCVWEEQIRCYSKWDQQRERGWSYRILIMVGLVNRDRGFLPRGPSSVGLQRYFADDRDVKIRRWALAELARWVGTNEPEIVPILQRHLDDDDLLCRLSAAQGIWTARRDGEIKAIVLPLIANGDYEVRERAAQALTAMAPADPELFEPLAKLAKDKIWHVRATAMSSMSHFGQRGLPILREGLNDANTDVRRKAISVASELRKDASDIVSDLLQCQGDLNPAIRREASNALYKIDPNRFTKPSTLMDD